MWATTLLDEGYTETSAGARNADPLSWPGYGTVDGATGDEAVRVFRGAVGAVACLLVVYDFTHRGGSQGAAAGARVADAFRQATAAGVPLVTVTATGGSRMQEGMVALAQMARTTVAAAQHRRAGLLQVTVASDPTTGGVYASFAGQADLVVAEPGAYVAFAGRRVSQALGGVPLPADADAAGQAHARGLVDAVVPRPELRAWLSTALALTAAPREQARRPRAVPAPARPAGPRGTGAWARVRAARAPDRFRVTEVVAACDGVVALRGDRAGGADDAAIACLALLAGMPVAIAGLDRQPVQPAGFRTLGRLLALAGRLGLPVLTLVDTPGADIGAAADAAGQAHAIGGTLARLLDVPVPSVCVVTGEGGSGGAMALAACDRLLLCQSAVFSVMSPEGAAAILHRDQGRAPEVAERLHLRAEDLVGLGIADAVVPDGVAAVLTAARQALTELLAQPPEQRLAARQARWGQVGERFLQPAPATPGGSGP